MPEVHWLTPIAERLARAEEVARSARQVVKEYESSGKVRVVSEKDGDEVILRLEEKAPPPPRLPLMVGEAIHHLRSSLDNLIVLLADRSAGRRLTAKEASHLQFPITSTPDSFAKSKRRLAGLSDDYINRIEEVQPYHLLTYALGEAAGIPPEREPLAELRELSNHDKHRRIHLVLHRASGLEVHHVDPGTSPEMELTQTTLTDGAVIARVRNVEASEVHATVELMVEHPLNGHPLRLEALLGRLIWMLSSEVIPHITGDRDLLGHPMSTPPLLD
ncbi:hypothetical protein [Phycicoccus sp. SLBN-51]|uniref:hypothetical protein n=1 Tax=Phycicoccus sp. SLBN-51 TaxID=2768447 RepID=UPI001152E74C|nr:hypothetical protein [Phycicoccus sp. SLBN-51]TQJ51842.1 hypothetical protein FBY26_3580 [Phycicoccus sp. SLBN-51]